MKVHKDDPFALESVLIVTLHPDVKLPPYSDDDDDIQRYIGDTIIKALNDGHGFASFGGTETIEAVNELFEPEDVYENYHIACKIIILEPEPTFNYSLPGDQLMKAFAQRLTECDMKAFQPEFKRDDIDVRMITMLGFKSSDFPHTADML